MKKFFMAICAAGILIMTSAQASSLHEVPAVMVLTYIDKSADFRPDDNLSKPGNISMISEFVEEFLRDTDRFRPVERERLKSVYAEFARQLGGTVSEDTIKQAGNHLGASYLVAGSVTGLSTKKSGVDYDHSAAGGGKFNKMTVVANVTMRFIDIETGEIVMAVYGTGESARTNAEFTLKRKTEEEYETTATDDSGIDTVSEDMDVGFLTQTLKIGGYEFTQAQVGNAIRKAVYDSIFNKKFGLLAKMDGKAKIRKV